MTNGTQTQDGGSILDRRTRNARDFEEGEEVTVHYQTSPGAEPKTMTGEVEAHYSDTDLLMGDGDGDWIVVRLEKGAGSMYYHEDGEEIGRPMFYEEPSEV